MENGNPQLGERTFVPVIVTGSDEDIAAIKIWWQNFYKKYFKLTLDFSDVKIPDYQFGFDWIIIIPKGLTIQQVLKAIKSKMKLWLYKDDLSDKDIAHNDRDANNGHYAVRFRKRVEADEETKNLSANELAKRKIAGCTLLERLIMTLAYFEESGKQLDVDNVTLCSGSRYSGGHVPRVGWYSDDSEVDVDLYDVDILYSDLRARVAVSC